MTPETLQDLPVAFVDGFVDLYSEWATEKADEDAESRQQCADHRAAWSGAAYVPQSYFERRAAVWKAIADGYSSVPYDDPRLSFSERRRRVARARYLEASYALKSALWGVDVTDAANADLLRDELDRFQAVAARHGWAVLATTREVAA